MGQKLLTFLNMLTFAGVAFMLSFEGGDKQTEGFIVFVLLVLFITSGVLSIFNVDLWNKAHSKESKLFHVHYRNLAMVLIVLYFSYEIAEKLEVIPSQLDTYELMYWIITYAVILMPNVTYLFLKKEPDKFSLS